VQTSDPSKIVADLLENDVDPKAVALATPDDSELFDDFMRTYVEECRKLLKQAKESHAVPEGMPEGVLIRFVMQRAAANFRVMTPQYKKDLKNLEYFV
jgi:hypothetical protein